MNIQLKNIFLSAALAALALPVAAQTAQSTTTPPVDKPVNKETVAERKTNQQERIANGMKDGELTAGEASKLEHRESKLNQETREMRAEDGGKLTAADKAKVQAQQNRLSKEIYNQKHDAQTQPKDPKSVAGQRAENQQDRIANGVASGQLNAAEASRLEHQEGKINQEVRADRAANGGKLTADEKGQVNRQQNRESRRIYRQKHDAQRRP